MLSRSAVATRVQCARSIAARLGLSHDVRYLAAAGAVQVVLDETAQVHPLLALPGVLRNAHTRAGVYARGDGYVRLHLRGTLDKVGPVIVTLPLHCGRRPQQARMVREHVSDTEPLALLEQLSDLDEPATEEAGPRAATDPSSALSIDQPVTP